MAYEVIVKEEVWDRLWDYTSHCGTEVAAFGYITNPEEIDGLYVDDAFLVPQDVSGSSVEFMEKGLPYAVEKAVEDGRVNDLRFCWHSHVNFGTSFSKTDEEMVEKLRQGGLLEWFVSAIFNKKGDTSCQLDLFKFDPLDLGLKGVALKLPILGEQQITQNAAIEAELETFLSKAKPEPDKTRHGNPVAHTVAWIDREREAGGRWEKGKKGAQKWVDYDPDKHGPLLFHRDDGGATKPWNWQQKDADDNDDGHGPGTDVVKVGENRQSDDAPKGGTQHPYWADKLTWREETIHKDAAKEGYHVEADNRMAWYFTDALAQDYVDCAPLPVVVRGEGENEKLHYMPAEQLLAAIREGNWDFDEEEKRVEEFKTDSRGWDQFIADMEKVV